MRKIALALAVLLVCITLLPVAAWAAATSPPSPPFPVGADPVINDNTVSSYLVFVRRDTAGHFEFLVLREKGFPTVHGRQPQLGSTNTRRSYYREQFIGDSCHAA